MVVSCVSVIQTAGSRKGGRRKERDRKNKELAGGVFTHNVTYLLGHQRPHYRYLPAGNRGDQGQEGVVDGKAPSGREGGREGRTSPIDTRPIRAFPLFRLLSPDRSLLPPSFTPTLPLHPLAGPFRPAGCGACLGLVGRGGIHALERAAGMESDHGFCC